MKRLVALPLILFISACGDAPTELGSEGPKESSTLLQQSLDYYPGCWTTDGQLACNVYHGWGNTLNTASCLYEECFEMTRSIDVRVVAADERGDFPATWFAWHAGVLVSGLDPTADKCILSQNGNKTRVEFEPGKTRCGARLMTEQSQYFEHFGSNPATGCLAWVECKVLSVP